MSANAETKGPCDQHGHEYDVVAKAGGPPEMVVCVNCGKSWKVEQETS